MKFTELTQTELKTINGGGRIAEAVGYYGTAFFYYFLGYNNREDIVKSPY
ncbi:bacteriocin [Epilithonimonas hispanica]|uniref:Bacteriocin n=1 Tax=Epilithonimonas hispanica TaxID=358687 RepID=A0A3D9D4S0_9FLAO|nr:bacteriocin [Epilithonimonas hispanica]REC72995.1 hypothetical protein DRF58_01180 [Epilithonimonas hispanica]